MASAWGKSWEHAWGDSWGTVDDFIPSPSRQQYRIESLTEESFVYWSHPPSKTLFEKPVPILARQYAFLPESYFANYWQQRHTWPIPQGTPAPIPAVHFVVWAGTTNLNVVWSGTTNLHIVWTGTTNLHIVWG